MRVVLLLGRHWTQEFDRLRLHKGLGGGLGGIAGLGLGLGLLLIVTLVELQIFDHHLVVELVPDDLGLVPRALHAVVRLHDLAVVADGPSELELLKRSLALELPLRFDLGHPPAHPLAGLGRHRRLPRPPRPQLRQPHRVRVRHLALARRALGHDVAHGREAHSVRGRAVVVVVAAAVLGGVLRAARAGGIHRLVIVGRGAVVVAAVALALAAALGLEQFDLGLTKILERLVVVGRLKLEAVPAPGFDLHHDPDVALPLTLFGHAHARALAERPCRVEGRGPHLLRA